MEFPDGILLGDKSNCPCISVLLPDGSFVPFLHFCAANETPGVREKGELTAIATQNYCDGDTVSVSVDHTIGDEKYVFASSDVTLTIPSAIRKRPIKIKNIGTGVITIVCQAGETVDGQPSVQLTSQYDKIEIKSDESNWFIV